MKGQANSTLTRSQFPPSSVENSTLSKAKRTAVCGWKGTASYYNITVDGMFPILPKSMLSTDTKKARRRQMPHGITPTQRRRPWILKTTLLSVCNLRMCFELRKSEVKRWQIDRQVQGAGQIRMMHSAVPSGITSIRWWLEQFYSADIWDEPLYQLQQFRVLNAAPYSPLDVLIWRLWRENGLSWILPYNMHRLAHFNWPDHLRTQQYG